VLATVDGSDNDGIGVEIVTENLARVGQLENALTHFRNGAVYLIEKEEHRTRACISQPIGRAEASHFAVSLRKTNEVALSHLRSTALDDRQTHVITDLINKFGLADTVTASEHEGLADVKNVGSNGNKSLKIDSHDNSIIGKGF
tara:strand:- start:1027 stop:1458 length:432 start_codon:yes stop_codon:yes gene_type:complete